MHELIFNRIELEFLKLREESRKWEQACRQVEFTNRKESILKQFDCECQRLQSELLQKKRVLKETLLAELLKKRRLSRQQRPIIGSPLVTGCGTITSENVLTGLGDNYFSNLDGNDILGDTLNGPIIAENKTQVTMTSKIPANIRPRQLSVNDELTIVNDELVIVNESSPVGSPNINLMPGQRKSKITKKSVESCKLVEKLLLFSKETESKRLSLCTGLTEQEIMSDCNLIHCK